MLYSRRTPYARIRNVQRVRRSLSDGRYNYHHYHRPTRKKLPGHPGSPEFMTVYQECERLVAEGTPDTKPERSEEPVPALCSRHFLFFRTYGWR
jgi:hypothetical protein